MERQNRETTSDLHPDKESVNNGVKIKSEEVVLEEPEVKLQLWAPDATCALRHEGEEATNTPVLTTECRIFLFLSPARARHPHCQLRDPAALCVSKEMELGEPFI